MERIGELFQSGFMAQAGFHYVLVIEFLFRFADGLQQDSVIVCLHLSFAFL